ncbi:MAG TPA: hypothetical protein VEV15_01885, partial [Flavisolibacter sp.]|nr:hypothetical protein [Flavisolibacter sp.]
MKKILMFLCLVVYFLPGCKKEDEKTGQKDRFEIVDSKSIVRGNLILGQALNDSNLLVIAFKNAPSNTSATITADTVNGMYIEPTTINLEGSSTVSIKMKGTPITDGTFVLMIKVKINGVTYISSKEFYVDLPNYTSINLTLSDSAFYNIVDSAKIAFQVDPKSTDFTIVAPAHIKAEIQSVSANERILKVTADSAFVMGDVLITGTFRNVPPIVKTIHLYAFAGGKGSSAAPFEIPDVKRLQKIQYALDKAYKLTADITQPASLVSNSVFTGILDGSGHTISNVSINAPATNNTGYFQEIGVGGVVKNLTFKNTAITGQDFVGVVAGINRGTITNLTITGTLKGRTYIGGIAGNNFGTVTSCNVMGLTISGANNIGSLAGSVNASSSETDNSVLIIPASFQTEVFGIAGPQTITFGFLPSDGTIAVKTVPANLTATAVAGQQTV